MIARLRRLTRRPRHDIAARRLVNHRLAGGPLRGAAEVVRRLGAVQAQDYPVARWSIGQRARGLTEADVNRALPAEWRATAA